MSKRPSKPEPGDEAPPRTEPVEVPESLRGTPVQRAAEAFRDPRPHKNAAAVIDAATASAAAATNPDGTRGIGAGASPKVIDHVQTRLKLCGHAPGAPGQFDTATAEAVRAFQAASGLPVNGRVDLATWARLRRG